MRNLRKLTTLTALTLAVLGLTATTATAAVEVRNGSDEHCSDVTCEGTVQGHFQIGGNGGPAAVSCDFEATLSSDGYGNAGLSNIEFSGDWCNSPVNDCNDAGWIGTIVGPGDDGYTATADYELNTGACIDGTWATSLNGVPFPLRFNIDNGNINNLTLPHQVITPTGVWAQGLNTNTTGDLHATTIE